MAELKATVCLQGKDIEVISSHIEFNWKIHSYLPPSVHFKVIP